MDVLLGVLETPEFVRGLIAGLVVAGIGWLLRRISPDWGLLWLVAVVAAGTWSEALDRAATERAFSHRDWVAILAIIAFFAMTYGLLRNRHRPHTAIALLLSLGGAWATVPDTEHALLMLGVTIPLIFLWWPNTGVALGPAGAIVVAAGLVWAGGMGAVGRDGAFVGAFGALAAVALLDVPVRLRSSWAALGFHAAIVFGWSRLAGLSRSAVTALLIGAAVTLGVLAVKRWMAPRLNATSSRR